MVRPTATKRLWMVPPETRRRVPLLVRQPAETRPGRGRRSWQQHAFARSMLPAMKKIIVVVVLLALAALAVKKLQDA